MATVKLMLDYLQGPIWTSDAETGKHSEHGQETLNPINFTQSCSNSPLPKIFTIGYPELSRPAGLSTMLNWRVFSYLGAANGIHEAGANLRATS